MKFFCVDLGFCGMIFLVFEGINFFVLGKCEVMIVLLEKLCFDLLFVELEVKESFSDEIVFNWMLVKIK